MSASDILLAVLSGLAAAILTLAYQVYRDRNERRLQEEQRIVEKRLAIISELVAHRYVLTRRKKNDTGVAAFNAALNKIPVEFIMFPAAIDKYRAIGSDFNARAFHDLVIEMLRVTVPESGHIDYHLLETVPSVNLDNERPLLQQ